MRAREFIIHIPINIKLSSDGKSEISAGEDEKDDTEDQTTGRMVGPLQQKIEILKKSAGLPNVFDQEADDDEPLG